jgi:NAD(P)-dependent dehydrogenase (short-subunit alcohol dehydrogenase family)
MKKKILIIGGSSGLGLEIAKRYVSEGHNVCITGRNNPNLESATFVEFQINSDTSSLRRSIDGVVENFPEVNTLVYAAGFYQEGHIDQLTDEEILLMTNVALVAPMLFVQRLKNNNSLPLKVILITSSSEYTPRELEPVYCATKAGLGMFGASLVLDKEIGKVVVIAPSGIATPFWKGTNKDTSEMLDSCWLADEVIKLSGGEFKYKYARILKNPPRTEVKVCNDNDGKSLL